MYDVALRLKDAYLVAASAAGQVSSADKVLDIGEAEYHGLLVVDVTAIEIASNDELYKIKVQGCVREDFAHSYEDLAILVCMVMEKGTI